MLYILDNTTEEIMIRKYYSPVHLIFFAAMAIMSLCLPYFSKKVEGTMNIPSGLLTEVARVLAASADILSKGGNEVNVDCLH